MNELLPQLVQWIKPQNGLVVNANVWAEAHQFHRLQQQAHLLYSHGPGIITGLEVEVRSAGERFSVRPGLALDPQGRLIVLAEPDSLEIETEQTGTLYLYLQAGRERELEQEADPGRPQYVKLGHRLVSGLSLPADAVELVRVRLTGRNQLIKTAANPDRPAPQELDLRFRSEVGAEARTTVVLGIGYLGEPDGQARPKFGSQTVPLARALSHLTRWRIHIDDEVTLAQDLGPYTMLYLIEQGPHQLDNVNIEALRAFHRNGGTILVESDQSDSRLLKQLDAALEIALTDQLEPLLNEPFLFGMPPLGANQGVVYLGDGMIFSTCAYGQVWQRHAAALSRETLRAATEWAANLVAYAVNRHRSRPDAAETGRDR